MTLSTKLFAALLAVSLGGAVVAQNQVRRVAPHSSLEEVLYIPSAKVLKRLSLGYDGLLAGIYWTRAVQYFGGKHLEGALRYDLLYPLLDITTDLDPQLLVAYQFGSIFLAQPAPSGAGQPERAVELAEKGIRHNPREWRLYYSLGFTHAMERKDYRSAAGAFQRGAEQPGAHPWLKPLAALMSQRGGEIETARFMWTRVYESSDDEMIKRNALERLAALQVDEDVARLEQLARDYKQKTGRHPASFAEMLYAGWLRQMPSDPKGLPYRLMPDLTVQVHDPEAWIFAERGKPPGWAPRPRPKARAH